jgi:uncharacterized protein (TIGR00255 family)
MPVRSMTGFSQAETRTPSGLFRVEIRAVNNRFFEIQLRQPKILMSLEQKIKAEITDIISRGSVSVYISCDKESDSAKLSWDKESVDSYVTILKEIKKKYKLSGEITLTEVLNCGDILKTESSLSDEKTVWKHFKPVLGAALEKFQESREAEGAHTIKELKKTLDGISKLLCEVEARAPKRIEEYTKELNKRIEKLIATQPDEQRLALEVAIMADKMDIAEECCRLKGHIAAVTKDFSSHEPIGKRLNFLLQEMNREANTIGSKANDTVVSHLSVALKEKIEQIREQIQNIE